MPDLEENELSYEDFKPKIETQPDIRTGLELRPEDFNIAPAPAPRKRKVAAKPKPAQPTTFQFGPMMKPAKPPSTFRGTPLSGRMRGEFEILPQTEAEWRTLTPEQKLAFTAAQDRISGKVTPSVRQSTPEDIAYAKKAEDRDAEIKARLEGKTFFGVNLPDTPSFLDYDVVRDIRQGFGHAHDVLTYQTPNVFLKGLAAIPEGMYEIGKSAIVKPALGELGLSSYAPLDDGPTSVLMRRFTNKAEQVVEEAFPTREEKNPLAVITGSAAQFIIPGGAVTKLGVPATAAAGIFGAAMNVQQVAREMDAAGVDPRRRDNAIAVATLSGLTEMVGLGAMIDKFGLHRTFVRQLIEIGEEGGQEAVQQWLNNLNAKLIGGWDPNRPLSKDVVENTLLGIGGGILFAGINKAAIRDREKAFLRSRGLKLAEDMTKYPMQVVEKQPVQQELPFEAQAPQATPQPAEKELPLEEFGPINVSPTKIGKREKVAGERHPITEMPVIEEVEVKPKDITSFKVKEGKDRFRSRDNITTTSGPTVPIDVIPVDNILSNKVDYTPEEKQAAKAKSDLALQEAQAGEPYSTPVPPPPTSAIIGPPGNRGVARQDVNRVKDNLNEIHAEYKGLLNIYQRAAAANDTEIMEAVERRVREIAHDMREHIDVIERNGEDGETFELLPSSKPGEAPILVAPGWVFTTLTGGGDHMAVGGVTIQLSDLPIVTNQLKFYSPSFRAETKAHRAINELIAKAKEQDLNTVLFLHQWQPAEKRNVIVPHETFHAAQFKAAELVGALNKYVDAMKSAGDINETLAANEGAWHLHLHEWAKSHPVVQRIATHPFWSDALKINTIDVHDSVAMELPAYIAGGDAHRFGLSEDEQVSFMLDYLEHLYQTHGVQVLDTFERVARNRPETSQMLEEARNRYEVWKQDQLDKWHDTQEPVQTQFQGVPERSVQPSDPLESIFGPRKAGTKPPTDKRAAGLAGKNADKEIAEISKRLFVERPGWTKEPTQEDYYHIAEGYRSGSVWKNADGTYNAYAGGKGLGEFNTIQEAKNAVQRDLDRNVISKDALERRGLTGLTDAIDQRMRENGRQLNDEEWLKELTNAIYGHGLWATDPVLNDLANYVREAYPEETANVEKFTQKYKEEKIQGGWENKDRWDIEHEEKSALEAISGPDVRFTDVEFTKEDKKQLKALEKVLTKALREHGYATGEKGYPTLEQWLTEQEYPVTYSELQRELGPELQAWQELKDKQYQSQGGKKGRRIAKSLADLPLDPRGGLGPRNEEWKEGTKYYNDVGENAEFRTGRIGNMHMAEVYPVAPESVVDEGRWAARVDNKHIGYYPDRMWAMAAAEREMDKVDVSWQSVQRRSPELADKVKQALMIADPSMTFGSREQFYDRLDSYIRRAVYSESRWPDASPMSEYQEYLQEMFPVAAEHGKFNLEGQRKRDARLAQEDEEQRQQDMEDEYKLREDEALHAIRDPRAEMMAQIRKELAEEKKQRAKEEGSLRIAKMLVDPATAKPGDRVRSTELNKYGTITRVEQNFLEVEFDDKTTEQRDIADFVTARTPPASITNPTNKIVPQTPVQQAMAQTPAVPSAVEEMEQMILPGMQGLMQKIKENRPPDLAAFDATLDKLLTSKGIKPNPTRRPFIQVLEGMITGKISAKEVNQLMEDNGLTMQQFMNEFKATALESENSSKQLMRIKMRWLKQLKKNPDLQTAMVFTPSELFKSVMEDINNTKLGLTGWQRFSNFIRALMLSDINTAMVNGLMTAGRVPLAAAVHGGSSWIKTMHADTKGKGLTLGQRINQANDAALDAMGAAAQVLLTMNPVDIIQNWRKTGTSHAERHTAIWNQLVEVFPDLEMKVKAPGIGLETHATISGQVQIAKDLITQMRTKGSRQARGAELQVAEDRLNSSLKMWGRVANGAEVAMDLLLSPMRWQEWFFRKPMFVGYLDLALRRRDMSLEDLLTRKDLESIPEDALKEAMDEALDFTYAYMPSEHGPGFEKSAYHIIKGINDMKGVAALVGTMFPRAVYNGMKFTYEYSPIGAWPGIKKMIRPKYTTDPITNETTRTNELTQKDYDRFAKATAGTIMFTTAMSLIKFGLMGDDWWQLRTGKRDKNGKAVFVDIRRYQPFSMFFRMADLTARIAHEAGTDFFGKKGLGDIQVGKEIKETLTGMKNFPGAEEYISATMDMWNDEDSESNVYQKAASSMGTSMSFFTRPFVNLRRAVAMFDEDEAVRRDVKGVGFFGPMIDNIPWVRQKMLPEYVSMTEQRPIYNESYPGMAFGGVRLIAEEGFAGREWRRLGFLNRRFLAPDPNPAINRKQNEIFQNIISNVGKSAETNPAYTELDDKGKAAYWERLVDKIAPIARKIGETADPKEMIKRDFRRKLNMGPLQRKNLGLNNIFDNTAPTPTP